MSSGHIYIVRLRESIRLKENVYKCGRTKNMIQRIKTYPLGTELLYCVQVHDMFAFEQLMLSYFREHFTPIPEMGAEYFKGNLTDMIKLLNTHLPIHLPCHENHRDNDSEEEGMSRRNSEDTPNEVEPGAVNKKKKDEKEIKPKEEENVKSSDDKKKKKKEVKPKDETNTTYTDDITTSDDKKKNKAILKTSTEELKTNDINDCFFYKNKYHCRYDNSIIHESYTKVQLMKKFKVSDSYVQDIQTKVFDETQLQMPYHIAYGYFESTRTNQYIDFKNKCVHSNPLYTIIGDDQDFHLIEENKEDQALIDKIVQQYVSKDQITSFLELYKNIFVSCDKGYIYQDAGLHTYSLLEWLISLPLLTKDVVTMNYKNKQEFDTELNKSLRKIKPSTRLIVIPILDQSRDEVVQKVFKVNPKCNIAFSNRSKKYKSPYSIKKLSKVVTKDMQIKFFTEAIKKEEFDEEYVRFIFECDVSMISAMFWWLFKQI